MIVKEDILVGMLRSATLFLVWFGRCAASFLPNNPQTISTASLEGEPTALIAGCVYALTGDYCETAVDLYIPGVEPLFFQRTFTSFWDAGSFMGGWSANTQCYLEKLSGIYAFTQEHGGKVFFSAKETKEGIHYQVDQECFKGGLTNCAGGQLGAKWDWKNAHLNPLVNGGEIITGDGTRYLFDKRRLKIFKPNGYVIKTSDSHAKKRKIVLIGLDGKEKGFIKWEEGSEGSISVEGSNDVTVVYSYKSGKNTSSLQIQGKHLLPITYIRSEIKKGECVGRIKKILPEGRFMWIDHYRSGSYGMGSSKTEIQGREDLCYGRVYSLKEPVGDRGEPIETYRFVYRPEEKSTDVFDAFGHLTRYFGDECNRLSCIEHYTGQNNYQLYCSERLYWTKDGRLRCKALLGKDKHPCLCVHYEYDQKGNILTESVWGNLTGNGGNHFVISPQGIPSAGENYKRHYTYSDDGLNLKLSEKNRKQHIFYKYHTGSNRLAAKLISDKRKICSRTFYHYDAQGAVCVEISDDGSSEIEDDLQDVSERHITRFVNQELPLCGLPLRKEEFYLDLTNKKEMALVKTTWRYDKQGRKTSEKRYDGEGHLLYSLQWEYDPLGHLLKAVNAVGQITEYQYDKNGNKIFEKGPDPELTTRYNYDCSNRLISTERRDRDGTVYTTSSTYYYTHQKYTETDSEGDTTSYRYDDLGRLEIVQYPEIKDANGKRVHPRELFEYDLQGFLTKHVGSEGGTTLQENTVYGKPARIEGPTGAVEQFTYNLLGDLVQHSKKGGETLSIQRDYQSRPILEQIFDGEGRLISKKEMTYNAFHLLSEKGTDGIETSYTYDGAGRLIKKQSGKRSICYAYNSFGQVVQEKDFYDDGDEECVETNRAYDAMGRIIEERNNQFWEKYDYDLVGYRSSTTRYIDKTAHKTIYRYDILGRVVEEKRGKDKTTRYLYEQHKKTTVDPLGNQIVEIVGPRGYLRVCEFYDPFNKLHLRQTWIRDREGRKLAQFDEIFDDGRLVRTHSLGWEYDYAGNLIRKMEGLETTLQKNHLYHYDLLGRKVKWIKPDGVEINYCYDCSGNLLELKSSDGTVHYLYHYNKAHQLDRVDDCIHGTQSLSAWDRQGCLSHEKLANGLCIGFKWNGHSRIKRITLPDKSGIAYTYQKGILKSVCRISSKGEMLYQQIYESLNSEGAPLLIQLPGNAGAAQYSYNREGLLTELNFPQWEETALAYDLKGNLVSRSVNGKNEKFYYDALSHLQRERSEEEILYKTDSLGNRFFKNGTRCEVNGLNQITREGNIEYVYDPCGRLICRIEGLARQLFVYDALDRLIEIRKGEERIVYTYDYAHRRMSKEAEGVKTFFIYQGQNEIGEQDEQGNWLNFRVLGLGKGAEIGAAVAIELIGTPYVPLHSSTGSVAALVDLNGNLVEKYIYTAYGEEKGSFVNPWRFSSKRSDPETDFIFFGRRFYIPKLGRWLTPDPLEEEGGPNVYTFVACNPLTHIDLYGLFQERPSLFQKIGRVLGTVVKGIGDHLFPLPRIRDALSALGHRLKGGSRLNFRELCRNPHSALGYLSSPAPEKNISVAYICGILNRPDDCLQAADRLSNLYGGAPIHFCYNSSEGLILDLMESAAQILGFKTHTVELASQLLRERIKAVGERGEIHLHLHSQGGIIGFRALQKLTSSEQRQVHVITYGSAKLIQSKELASVTNIIAQRDPIPWIADPLGCARAYWTRSDQIKTIPSIRSPIASHSIENYLAHWSMP